MHAVELWVQKECEGADTLTKAVNAVAQEGQGLQNRLAAVVKENIDLRAKAEVERARNEDLEARLQSDQKEHERLVQDKKVLQREVDAVRRLPSLRRQYERLNSERLAQLRGDAGRTLLQIIAGTATGSGAPIAAGSWLGPWGVLASLPLALFGGVKIMSQPLNEEPYSELCEDTQDIRLQIVEIAKGIEREDFLKLSKEERQKIYEELKVTG